MLFTCQGVDACGVIPFCDEMLPFSRDVHLTSGDEDTAARRISAFGQQRSETGQGDDLSPMEGPQQVYATRRHSWLALMALNIHEDAMKASARHRTDEEESVRAHRFSGQ